jgi:hypothetical protein
VSAQVKEVVVDAYLVQPENFTPNLRKYLFDFSTRRYQAHLPRSKPTLASISIELPVSVNGNLSKNTNADGTCSQAIVSASIA